MTGGQRCMVYEGTVFFLVMIIIAAIIFYLKKKKQKSMKFNILGRNHSLAKNEQNMPVNSSSVDELIIPIETVPANSIQNADKWMEIKDSKILKHIDNLVPELTQAGIAANNVQTTAKAAKTALENGQLYRAIIPSGAELLKSKDMEGAVRGMYSGAKGIKGHANLVAVDPEKGVSIPANAVSAVMSIGSLIVGEYYMREIDAELDVINNGIKRIQNFQNNEFLSRVYSLISHVKRAANFQYEILENDELRLSKITELDNLEKDCTELLGQANLMLLDFTAKTNLKYKEYEKEIGEIQNWFMYQQSLLDVLYKISDLRYTLHKGTVSRKQCVYIQKIYEESVRDTQEKLTVWHNKMAKNFGIEIDKARIKRSGIDMVSHFVPGLFDHNLNFRALESKTGKMITEQMFGSKVLHRNDQSELYSKDIQLISKDG